MYKLQYEAKLGPAELRNYMHDLYSSRRLSEGPGKRGRVALGMGMLGPMGKARVVGEVGRR